ncbi:MAG: hypothetical protein DRP45_04390 [Candidatus Zixiibacteriota bacterium]|nr:MAG: hypothetical protein DRP45_04390 [candidate division Zixibacteria bacterium]
MPRYLIILALLICAISMIIFVGCDDRGTGVTTANVSKYGIDPGGDHAIQPELTYQIRNPQEMLLGTVYIPEVAMPPSSQPVPLLILLAPEYGNRYYFFEAGLEEIANEMIASGEIDPMVIYCVGNDPTFGGFFYGNSYANGSPNNIPSGNYDGIIGDKLVDWLTHDYITAIIDQSAKRGIGGVGQGAYGAFRAVLKHPGVFSSISVTDGPLDFNGRDDASGLMDLFQTVIDEQSAHFIGSDADTMPFDFFYHFDSSYTMPVSMMFVGGALAFSPNDTLVEFTRYTTNNVITVTIDARYPIAADTFPGGGDSSTFVYNVITDDISGHDFDFHLPFDANGSSGASNWAWSRWLSNNLDSLYMQAGNGVFDSTKIWVATSPCSKWNYHEMTTSWIEFLGTQGDSVEVHNYSGHGYSDVSGDEYTYDLLRKMLKFHSDNFKNN